MATSAAEESVSATHSGKKGKKAKTEGELMFFFLGVWVGPRNERISEPCKVNS